MFVVSGRVLIVGHSYTGFARPFCCSAFAYDVELVREQIIRPRQWYIQRINSFSDMKMNRFIEEFHVLMHAEGELDSDCEQSTLERFWNDEMF